jgi:hypothetical protein
MTETDLKPPAKVKVGAPTKRTAQLAKLICEAVGRGIPLTHSCALAGVSYSTFCDWRNEDENFRELLQAAIAEGVNRRLAQIEKAADLGDWRASAWLLEHTQPEHFSKSRVQLEHIGQVEHSFVIPQQTLNEISEARTRYENDGK